MHYVRIFAIQDDPWDFQVDGSEITFDRVKRILDANGHGDADRMTRAFKTFVKRWNLVNDDGNPIPITVRGVKEAGLETVTAITIEIVHALDIPKEPWDRAMTYKETGEPVRVQTSSTPLPPFDPSNPSLREPAPSVRAARPSVTPPRRSAGAAFVFWLLLGLIGGHRYYLGRPVSGFLMTITIGGLGVWWLLDLFLLPGMVRKANADS